MAFVPFHLANIDSVCLFFLKTVYHGFLEEGGLVLLKQQKYCHFMKSVIRWGIGGLGEQQAPWSLALDRVSRLVIYSIQII